MVHEYGGSRARASPVASPYVTNGSIFLLSLSLAVSIVAEDGCLHPPSNCSVVDRDARGSGKWTAGRWQGWRMFNPVRSHAGLPSIVLGDLRSQTDSLLLTKSPRSEPAAPARVVRARDCGERYTRGYTMPTSKDRRMRQSATTCLVEQDLHYTHCAGASRGSVRSRLGGRCCSTYIPYAGPLRSSTFLPPLPTLMQGRNQRSTSSQAVACPPACLTQPFRDQESYQNRKSAASGPRVSGVDGMSSKMASRLAWGHQSAPVPSSKPPGIHPRTRAGLRQRLRNFTASSK
ncbi:hypothetical protein B0T25DRAFT_524523 [Lasiosphaeria hispida]|uniref:Uncharacterized protein n=1 Tax=Lasiosphaeria hispida TaxID=260671 RepID=A0AAJ0HTS5_9PEZI|nr:hypothetical protein B0T25DRAFT_524523 [Lasiosphaeria hispida]